MIPSIELEKIRYGVQTQLSKSLIVDFVDVAQGYIEDALMVTVKGHVWGRNSGRIEYQHPRDWWQAFKQRFFPAWAIRRWPIVYTVKAWEVKDIWPEYIPALPPSFGQYLRIAIDMPIDYRAHLDKQADDVIEYINCPTCGAPLT